MMWLNGEPVAANLQCTTAAPKAAVGVFETLLVTEARLHFVDVHLQRLCRGLNRLSIILAAQHIDNDLQKAVGYLSTQFADRGSWRLKYSVWLDDDSGVQRLLQLQRYDRDVASLQQQGVHVDISRQRLESEPALAGLKLLQRSHYDKARQECCNDQVFEALMLDQQDHIIEGSISNIFAVIHRDQQSILITPPLHHGGVAGISRQLLLTHVGHGLQVEERYLPPLDEIAELFICNSLLGIVPVVQLQQQHFAIGAVTRHIQQSYAALNPF